MVRYVSTGHSGAVAPAGRRCLGQQRVAEPAEGAAGDPERCSEVVAGSVSLPDPVQEGCHGGTVGGEHGRGHVRPGGLGVIVAAGCDRGFPAPGGGCQARWDTSAGARRSITVMMPSAVNARVPRAVSRAGAVVANPGHGVLRYAVRSWLPIPDCGRPRDRPPRPRYGDCRTREPGRTGLRGQCCCRPLEPDPGHAGEGSYRECARRCPPRPRGFPQGVPDRVTPGYPGAGP
jgi:hypothetical protein